MTWPADWPEENKVGPGFLAELLKRFPDQVKTGSLEQGKKWLDESSDESPSNGVSTVPPTTVQKGD